MIPWRQALSGILWSALSLVITVGAIVVATVEKNVFTANPPTTAPPLPTPNLTPIIVSAGTQEVTPSSPTPLPPSCDIPSGWLPYVVKPGDTIEHLAQALAISPQQIVQGNCLLSSRLFPDTVLYLPPIAFPTPSPSPTNSTLVTCTPPPGWSFYVVKSGDTLTRISGLYGITVWQLKQANCLESNLILSGQRLWVPPVPTRTFTATTTPTEHPAPEATATSTPQPTPTPPPPPPSPTSVLQTPTETPSPSETPSATPSFTTQVSETPTPETSPTETFIASPSS